MTQQHASYGAVHGPPKGEITRRNFMRRMLGVGVGILSLEFLGGTMAFLWPNLSEGLGADINLGTADDINSVFAEWAEGLPFIDRTPYKAARDRKLMWVFFLCLMIGGLVTTFIGSFFRGPGWNWVWPWEGLFFNL